jgi:predicted phosphohydrolase
MKIHNEAIVKRWDSVMNDIGCEYLTIGESLSELEYRKDYYDVEAGISVDWMIKEAKYWLSCYYEVGNCRCDDRFLSKDDYKMWLSESGRLKRLIARLEKMENIMVVTW